MTLRVRLTLIYVVIATVAIAGLGVTAYVVARDATLDSVDQALEADVRAIEASFEHLGLPLTQADVEQSRLALDRQAAQGHVFQVRDPSGRLLYTSQGALLPADGGANEGVQGFLTIESPGADTRVYAEPIVRIGEVIGTIEVRTPLDQADASIEATRNVLAVGSLVAVALSGAVAFIVAGNAARPAEALARLAADVERTADFTRRLPEKPSTREMQEMAVTFNRMIARVEQMLAAQRHFLSDTSHELRRPLTILRMDIDILTDPNLAPADLETVQLEMRSAAASMSSLLTELLILARQDEDTLIKEPVDFSSLCRSAVQATAATHPGHRFDFHVPYEVWVEGDRLRLERMVGNVLANAAAYTDAPGFIDSSVKILEGRAILTVADTGNGMTPDEMAHIFDRFFRGSTGRRLRPEGSGLGLPIVKQIAESHGGGVEITSQAGTGTTVTITLPLLSLP